MGADTVLSCIYFTFEEDYSLLNNQQLTLRSGQTVACLNVTIEDDFTIEVTECVSFVADVNDTNIEYILSQDRTEICIENDDGEFILVALNFANIILLLIL